MATPDVRRVLFPTDFSSCAERAYRHAAYLAERFGADLLVLHVVETPAAPERDWPESPGLGRLRITLADVCADLGLPAPEADHDADPADLLEIEEMEVVGRKAAPAILDVAYDEDVDLIVMGTHGRTGWRRGVLGSVAEAVARRAPCPVLTVRPVDADAGPWPPQRVLLAVDGYESGDPVPAAARWAARLAEAYGAPLDLLHVTPPVALVPGGPIEANRERAAARAALLDLADVLRGEADELHVHVLVRTGEAVETIAAVAEGTRTHLLVVGTHGRRAAGRVLLGSVAEAVARVVPCPVLVVRDGLAEAGGARLGVSKRGATT